MNPNILISFCWMLAMISTLGSLFFSEVMEFPPCSLCWYQRIAMYPLCAVFLVGIYQGARATLAFATPLVAMGWLTALYHNLIHWEIIPESASPCREGIPCSIRYIEWLNFVTIPLLSLTAFTMLALLLIKTKRMMADEK